MLKGLFINSGVSSISNQSKISTVWLKWLENLNFRLAKPDALLYLAIFGLITGLLSGGVIIIFRLFVESSQDFILPGKGSENYEALAPWARFIFPVVASVLMAILFYKWSNGIRVLGIARVMERVTFHQGYLTLRGFIIQFLGASLAIIGGHSVGREGPHAYLGASISSLFAQLFKLPNNSIRTLVASGSAAAIAASFNTPLAGVIFALEVIMMEYTLTSFVPVMLAAVSATALSNTVFSSEPAFSIAGFVGIPISEYPVVIALGIFVGACAAGFNHLLTFISSRSQVLDIWWRVLLAGLIIGSIGIIQPSILGIGYDTLNSILSANYVVLSLIGFAFFKIVATSVSVGLGVPGGMIGPAFFIGASLGGIVGIIAMHFYGFDTAHIISYSLLGMGAMMGASLQAPLSALVAIVELTYKADIIMPGMLVIIIAQLTASEVFKKQSLFVTMLRSNGLDYSLNPVLQLLRAVGVATTLEDTFERYDRVISVEEANFMVKDSTQWIVINDLDGDVVSLMQVSELAKYLQINTEEEYDEIDLLSIPADRLQLSAISLRANLMQAHERFRAGEEAFYVVFSEKRGSDNSRIYGVLTPAMIDKAYLPE